MVKVSKTIWKYLAAALVAAVLLSVLLMACRGGRDAGGLPPLDLAKGFTAKADIRFGGIEATATLNRIADGICDVTLIAPKALNGMKFQYNGSDIEISYLGMSVKTSDDSLLANAMAAALVKAVDAAARDSGISMKKSGKTILMKGTNDNGAFELRLDKNTGALLSLKIPSMDLECTFSDMTVESAQ